ncbi:MAG: FAD-binding oxidoreductase [Pseudomonadota bacterium]
MKERLVTRFIDLVGEKHALLPQEDISRYTHENRGLYIGKTPVVLKPNTTEQVAQIVRLAHETGTAIVPQGGHTGHVGGAVPDESGTQIVVSLERMNKVREIDLESNVVVCEAGCILEGIQNIADQNDRLFPLALAAQGSCQIGGNISTNAGGTGVLAYGNTRQLVMGLEVVLPSGDIWHGLRRLKKDNTGYDLKNLFIGAEGSLGIVTAAVLKLFPKPKGKGIALCGLESASRALSFFQRINEVAGSSLTAFELMGRIPVAFTLRHMSGTKMPLEKIYPWQVLVEISSNRSQEDATSMLEEALESVFSDGLVCDASIAASVAQQKEFWDLREKMPLAQKQEGGSIKHDVSVSIHKIPEFLDRANTIIGSEIKNARICAFGHLGDGNIHYNISQPENQKAEDFLAQRQHINDLIHALVVEMDGSVAAEHGVGRLKQPLIAKTKSSVELGLMKSVKQALDPQNIINPVKVL